MPISKNRNALEVQAMHYEITVYKNGRLYFATSEKSLKDQESAIALTRHFKALFPESEGYKVSLSYVQTSKTKVHVIPVKSAGRVGNGCNC
jgi:hypothetical protein